MLNKILGVSEGPSVHTEIRGVQVRGVGLKFDILFVTLVMHFLGLALPLALLQIYDRILPSQAYGTAVFLVAGVGFAIILESILRYGRTVIFANIGAQYEAQATLNVFAQLELVDINEIEQRGAAYVSDVMRSIAQIRDFWSGQAGVALYEIPFVFIYIGLIAYIGGWLALIPLVLFIVAVLIALILNRSIAGASLALDSSERVRSDFAWASFASLPYLKAIGAEGVAGAMWRRINSSYLNSTAVLETRMGWVRENAATMGQLSTVLIVAFGALEVISGSLTTGALAACSLLAGRSIGPAMASLGYWAQLTKARDAQLRINDLLELPTNPALAPSSVKSSVTITKGEICIDAPTLFANKVTIQPGEVVHLDSEDTTQTARLLTAISGMSRDDDIQILIDGYSLQSFSRDRYRNDVMLVSKQVALVPGSILNNIALYDARYHAKIEALSSMMGLQPYLDKMRYGILTDVGVGGTESLDEGVAQRIALIRALVREPKVLLIDHAASAIDLDGVKRLGEFLQSLQGKVTIIIATNKAPLIAACNRTLTLSRKERAL